MAQGVSGQWYLDLKVGGDTLNANPTTLPVFQIINSIHQRLPSIKFTLNDVSGQPMQLASIADGTPITVGSFGVPEDFYPDMNFITLGMPPMKPSSNSVAVTVQGTLDKPAYLRKVVDTFYEGNSSDVLSQMVSAIGLIPDVDQTNDLMDWLPISKTIASMARHISKHGWASDASCMLTAVTDSGIFKYKNLEKIIKGGSSKTFASAPSQGEILVLDWEAAPKSHFANAATGYGSTSARTMSDGLIEELKDVSVTMLSQFLPMAENLVKAIDGFGSRINFTPLDAGNAHEKWAQAKHQNERISSTFAFDVTVLIDKPSHVDLLELVHFVPIDPTTGKVAANMVGDYVVSTVTKVLHGQRFYEKLTLTSQGLQTANFAARG